MQEHRTLMLIVMTMRRENSMAKEMGDWQRKARPYLTVCWTTLPVFRASVTFRNLLTTS